MQYPIIDLLKRIVIALPDYAGGSGELPEGMNHINSGEILFASLTTSNTPIDHGLNYIPKAVIIWTNAQVQTVASVIYCLLSRNLANNTGTIKTERFLVDKISTTSGIEAMTYNSDNEDFFITNNTFNIGHGSKYYEAGTMYYWFAFD